VRDLFGSTVLPFFEQLRISGLNCDSLLNLWIIGMFFEDGDRTTVGASRKGRIWSHRRDRIDQLAAWCKAIGAKLLDESIDPDEVLKGTLEAKTITQRPALMPITVDWPEEMYTTAEMLWSVVIGERDYPLSELDLELVLPRVDGPLKFKVVADEPEAELELQLFEDQEGPNYGFLVARAVQSRCDAANGPKPKTR
jgi:hypothetical protein